MGGMSSSFGGLGDSISGLADVASIAAAPATGGASLVAPAIMGGASLLGGLMSNQSNQGINSANQAFNASQSQAQMNFQKEMRATQYQTSVADLKAAGLNPMLAYTNGGAGNLQGSAASATAPAKMENVLAPAAQSAMQAANVAADIKVKDAQTNELNTAADLNEEKRINTSTDSDLKIAQTLKEKGFDPKTIQEILNKKEELKYTIALKGKAGAEASLASAQEASVHQGINIKKPEENNASLQFWIKQFQAGAASAADLASAFAKAGLTVPKTLIESQKIPYR